MGFTQKAKDSNAVTELTQVKTVLAANLLDGQNDDFKYDTTSDKLYVSESKKANEIKFGEVFDELKNLNGKYNCSFANAAEVEGTTYATMWEMTKVVYTLDNGGSATWTLGTNGSIVAGTK